MIRPEQSIDSLHSQEHGIVEIAGIPRWLRQCQLAGDFHPLAGTRMQHMSGHIDSDDPTDRQGGLLETQK